MPLSGASRLGVGPHGSPDRDGSVHRRRSKRRGRPGARETPPASAAIANGVKLHGSLPGIFPGFTSERFDATAWALQTTGMGGLVPSPETLCRLSRGGARTNAASTARPNSV